MIKTTWLLIGIIFCWQVQSQPKLDQDAERSQTFDATPSYFVPNQVHAKTGKALVDQAGVIAFLQTPHGRVLFTANGAYFGFSQPTTGAEPLANPDPLKKDSSAPHTENLPSANSKTVVMKAGFSRTITSKADGSPRLVDPSGATFNYLIGSKDHWQTEIPAYKTLVYDNVWAGVDVIFKANRERLTYQVVIKPGADLDAVSIETGADRLELEKAGRLKATLAGASFYQSKPVAYQVIEGARSEVSVKYTLKKNGKFGFHLGDHNKELSIIVEPQLNWSSLLGGPGFGAGGTPHGLAVDAMGFAYVTGSTSQSDFPVTTGSYDPNVHGGWDAYVTKFDTQNSQLVYSTIVGGLYIDNGFDIVVNSDGSAIVAGITGSPNFPTTANAIQPIHGVGTYDAFCFGLSPDGTSFTFSTYLGGRGEDQVRGLALDHHDFIYLTGGTYSDNFPTTENAFTAYAPGSYNAFVTKLSPDGESIIFSTYLGGSGYDYGEAIKVDSEGNAHIFGLTNFFDFPITSNVIYPSMSASNYENFLTKLNNDGSNLIYSTFLASEGSALYGGLALDSQDYAYVVSSPTEAFQTTEGAYDREFDNFKSFVCKIGKLGHQLEYATFFGYGRIHGVAVDPTGNAVVLSTANSDNFPTTPNSYDTTHNGSGDAAVSKLNATGSGLIFSTFLGGSSNDKPAVVALGPNSEVYLAGLTVSTDFPTTPGSFNPTILGLSDQFLSKLNNTGTELLYSTLYGGSGQDGGSALTVDSENQVTVMGYSRLSGYPATTGVFDVSHNGSRDIVVSQFNPNGSDLVFSTFIGGSEDETGIAMMQGSNGDFFVVGQTESADFPSTVGSFDETFDGPSDGFLLRLASDGTALEWSGFLGGSGADSATSLALDSSNNAYVAGITFSADLATHGTAYQPAYAGNGDAYVARVNSAGNDLSHVSYLGGSGEEFHPSLALDNTLNVVIAGTTQSADFPVTPGVVGPNHNGGKDAFVARFSPDLETLDFATFLGNGDDDEAKAVAVDTSSNIWVGGNTTSPDFPTTIGAFDETYNGQQDLFVAKLNSEADQLLIATFLGGDEADDLQAMKLDREENLLLTGSTVSRYFPTTEGAFLTQASNSVSNVFVSKFDRSSGALLYSTYFAGNRSGRWSMGRDIQAGNDNHAYITGETYLGGIPTTPGAFQEDASGGYDLFVSKLNLCNILEIEAHPSHVDALCPGDPLQFTVTVNGDGPKQYQWYKDDSPIPNATQATYYLAAATIADRGWYYCEITNSCTILTTILVKANVYHPIEIVTQPQDRKACLGESNYFFQVDLQPAVPSFFEPITYQWKKDGVDIPNGIFFSLKINNTAPEDFGEYTCLISNGCFSQLTEPAQLSYRDNPKIVRQPEAQSVCIGNDVTFTTEVTFDGELTYEWFRSNSSIPDSNSPTLTLTNVTPSNSGSYKCNIYNDCGTLTTVAVPLVLLPIKGALTPQLQTLGLDDPKFTFDPECGEEPITLEWTMNPPTASIAEGNDLILTGSPAKTTFIEMEAMANDGETLTLNATLLVSQNPLFRDFNGDGCNSIQDLLDAAQLWNQPYESDPNGDGRIDLLDLIYLNLSGAGSCP